MLDPATTDADLVYRSPEHIFLRRANVWFRWTVGPGWQVWDADRRPADARFVALPDKQRGPFESGLKEAGLID